MDYIEKLDLQTEEIEEVENLERHIINNGPISVNKYVGHDRDFLAIDGDYNDRFNQLNKTNVLGISCIVSKEVKEARKDVNGNVYEKLKDRIDTEVYELDNKITDKVDKEEGKQLSTNDFDNNLLALLRSWEEFKTNGGEIGGDIALSSLRELWLGDYSKNVNGYTKLPNGLILQWGLATIKTSAGGGRVEVTYPISFPNGALTQTTQIKNCLNDYTSTRIVTLGRAWKSSMTIFAQQVEGTIITDNTDCEICWLALGY